MEQLLHLRSSDPDLEAKLVQLHRVVESQIFRDSAKKCKFLRYVVEESILGNEIKETTVGIEIYKPDYDPCVDAHVRVAAREIRAMLKQYYAGEGASDEVVIELPLGTYSPIFRLRQPNSAEEIARLSQMIAFLELRLASARQVLSRLGPAPEACVEEALPGKRDGRG
ncbi:hypothetical protein [Paludibaculum fermentans]|uniref:Uncharacterized protein n=1 Tax=Paludibaculum fermentans TaxID=1473598 RepID=A0A7S7SJH7_PALFE|nr:hypothetical protein [Paludibaculum fermentans]QOY86708.1 hypothetical protein IRI77_28560 [Paludibaculum fermentans]